MKFVELPSGIIINLEAIAVIQAYAVYVEDNQKQGGIVVSYLAAAGTAKSARPMQSKLRGADADAFLLALEGVGVLTGHLRTAIKKAEELPNEDEDAD